jgi:prevent-host-death family protein
MNTLITAKELRASLPSVVRRVRKGARYTVIYRSRPAFQLIPAEDSSMPPGDAASDPLYRAKPLGQSTDGRAAADHDGVLYAK